MKRHIKDINGDAIVRFLFTYIIILGVIFSCCTICFHKAFAIVGDNLIEENEYLMKQEVNRIESIFEEAYTNGMELNSYDSLKHLGHMEERVQPDYYNVTKNVLSKYADILQ